MASRPIFLYGAPASGKSTLAVRLADRLGAKCCDLDALVADAAGRPIPDIFATEGEGGFRQRESAALRTAVGGGAEVIALGGGTLLDGANREFAESAGTVVCLETPSDEERSRRLGIAPSSRPLGDRARERASHYASFPNRVAATFEAGDSLVVVGSGFAKSIVSRYPTCVDATVGELWPIAPSPCAVIPSGERHKTIDTVVSLWRSFARAGLGRRDTVAALGGGVTGDLTGFASSTWMRGIDWVNVPTTLLAMVDASTGGKTGCDLDEGKNLAGTFHQPRLVAIDTDFLQTLSSDLVASGCAEMVKHALIGGIGVLPRAGALPTAAEIAGNLRVKVDIVREDPFETKGLRVLLNCGHTVAHAVERSSDYAISHGAAVAIGCVAESQLAVDAGLAPPSWPKELASTFAAFGLPTEMPRPMTISSLAPLMRGDKKRVGDEVDFALPCGWGDCRVLRMRV